MIDYAQIKQWAKEWKCRVSDLLALAEQNDPFYVGTPADLAQAEWFAQAWRDGGFSHGAHLRRIHYWCVSRGDWRLPNGKLYENTERCWQDLCKASKAARYLGLVRIADVADHKHPEPTIFTEYNCPGIISFEIETPRLSRPFVYVEGVTASSLQPYHLEVWCEKSTMDDVLKPVCERYGANLVTGEGEMTLKSVDQLVNRIRGSKKPARIFYLSDFDPAGKSIPCAVARKIEWNCHRENLDAKLSPLVLTREQVERYGLPRVPIKETEKRASRFEAVHGEGAVELDALEALHPGVLEAIVREALDGYHDYSAEHRVDSLARRLRQAVGERIDEITARYQPQIEALESMLDELRGIEIDLDDFQPGRAEPDADDSDHFWLYDSTRDYMEQLAVYKQHKNGGAETEEGAA